MNDSSSYLNWDDITVRLLYIVPRGDTKDSHYWEQHTIELTELIQKVHIALDLPSYRRDETIYAVFCWAFRNRDAIQTYQTNGTLYFENVVFIAPPLVSH